jgi:uncharacterized membrane protein
VASTHFRLDSFALHPLHAVLSAFPVPLFLGALLSDIGYTRSYQVQWINFSSWLIAGGLVLGGIALLWATLAMVRARRGRPTLYFLLLLVTWALGLINALTHARDAWATMPAGLILSAIVAVLALAANAIAYAAACKEGVK